MTDEKQPEKFDKENFISLFLNPEVPLNYKIIFMVGVALYTLSPIDFLPDVLPVFGFADDMGLAVVAAQIFTHLSNKKLENIHEEKIIEQSENQTQAPTAQPYSAQTAQPQAGAVTPHLPARHRNPQPPQAPRKNSSGDLLHDEAHEQYLAQKHAESNDEFERLIHEKEREKNANWDFERNARLNKK